MPHPAPTFLSCAAMRDEGPFIVEWVAWQRMLGFQMLIATNACTDHSVALLKAFQDAGWLTTFAHRPRPLQPPKISAHEAYASRPEVAAADWMFICDIDEFLILERGDGTIQSYLSWVRANTETDFDGIAFHWRNFGTSGIARWHDGLTHRQFRRCGPRKMKPNVMFKTLFRTPSAYPAYGDHAPVTTDGPPLRLLDTGLRPIAPVTGPDGQIRHTASSDITHETAQLNHYVLRSTESFALKKGRPSASAGRDRYTDRFFDRRDRNGQTDIAAVARKPLFQPVYRQAMALPGVRRLHHLCCADYAARLAQAAGIAAQDDPRWRDHMEQAGQDDTAPPVRGDATP